MRALASQVTSRLADAPATSHLRQLLQPPVPGLA